MVWIGHVLDSIFKSDPPYVTADSSKGQHNGATRDSRGILGEKGKNNLRKYHPLLRRCTEDCFYRSLQVQHENTLTKLATFDNLMTGTATKTGYCITRCTELQNIRLIRGLTNYFKPRGLGSPKR